MKQHLQRTLACATEPTPYNFAKYATAIASLPRGEGLDEALRLIEDVALPLALERGESLAYVTRDCAGLAMLTGDRDRAARLVSESERLCESKGQLHTLRQVLRMKNQLRLTMSAG